MADDQAGSTCVRRPSSMRAVTIALGALTIPRPRTARSICEARSWTMVASGREIWILSSADTSVQGMIDPVSWLLRWQ
ncbi:hypothetical protein [Pseudoxanthomonas sp. USHLN014]|uniref:hypothetical protein n=1 Tax=Pseudoxanthomonas sp. USHLN014 TaxID=3081297 RepID=UPI00301E4018